MDIDIVSIVLPKVQSWQSTAINFASTRFLVAASEFGMNDKESAELLKIAEGIQCEIFANGSSIGLNITYGHSPYLDIIQNGMPAPLSGGDGGIAHNPDNSTYTSAVPANLQGQVLEGFAKEGEDVMGEVAMMLRDLFRDEVQSAVGESKTEIAEAFKVYLIPKLS